MSLYLTILCMVHTWRHGITVTFYIKGCRPCRRPRKKLFGASHLEAFALFPMYIVVKFGSAGSTRVACPTSVPERLEL